MDTNAIYYTLSTIPQVIGALAAIVVAFAHFRIHTLLDYLVGDGKSILNRWGDIGYRFPNPSEDEKQRKRLCDAVDRLSVAETKNVVFELKEFEHEQGHSKGDRPRGLQYLYEDRFSGTETEIKKLRASTHRLINFSMMTVLTSVLSLALIGQIGTENEIMPFVLWINVTFFILSLIQTFRVIQRGLSEKTAHENDGAI